MTLLSDTGRCDRRSEGRPAQVFAPRDSTFVCFEPMTAPANALVTGGPDLPLVEPGGRYEAAFEIAVA